MINTFFFIRGNGRFRSGSLKLSLVIGYGLVSFALILMIYGVRFVEHKYTSDYKFIKATETPQVLSSEKCGKGVTLLVRSLL